MKAMRSRAVPTISRKVVSKSSGNMFKPPAF
jgi:hypothetical protein